MQWNVFDEFTLFDQSKIIYSKSDNGKYIKMEFKDDFHPVKAIANGTYIALELENGDYYYAVSASDLPEVKVDKIYVKEK
jgi:hypothetical protein